MTQLPYRTVRISADGGIPENGYIVEIITVERVDGSTVLEDAQDLAEKWARETGLPVECDYAY